jgi:hypothetical protein
MTAKRKIKEKIEVKKEQIETVQEIINRQERRTTDTEILLILNAMKSNLDTSMKYVNDNVNGVRQDITAITSTINNLQQELRDIVKIIAETNIEKKEVHNDIFNEISDVKNDLITLSESHCNPEEIEIYKEMADKYRKKKAEEENKEIQTKEIKTELIKEVGKKIIGIPLVILQDIIKIGGVAAITYIIAIITGHHK